MRKQRSFPHCTPATSCDSAYRGGVAVSSVRVRAKAVATGRVASAVRAPTTLHRDGAPLSADSVLELQRHVGNGATAALVQRQPAAPTTDIGFAQDEFMAGAKAYKAEDWETARSKFLASYLSSRTDAQGPIAFSLGQACRNLGRVAEARDWFEEYLASGEQGRRDDAMDMLRELQAGGPGKEDMAAAETEFNAGQAAFEAHDYEAARTHFLATYAAGDRKIQPDVAFNIGQCYWWLRSAGGIEWYEEYLATGDGKRRTDAMSAIRDLRAQSLEMPEGVSAPTGDRAKDLDAAKADYARGETAFNARDFEAARLAFINAYRLAGPGAQPEIAFSIGQACRLGGRPSESIGWFQEYLALGGTNRRDDALTGIREGRSEVIAAGSEEVDRPAAGEAGDPSVQRATVAEGSQRDDVMHLQRRLNALGVGAPAPPVSVTPTFDAATFARVVVAQEVLGLPVDGVVGPETWARIEREQGPVAAPGGDGGSPQELVGDLPDLAPGSAGPLVRRLQAALNMVPEVCGPALVEDGAFGPRTRARVILFGEAARIDSEGTVTARMWRALEQRAEHAVEATATP